LFSYSCSFRSFFKIFCWKGEVTSEAKFKSCALVLLSPVSSHSFSECITEKISKSIFHVCFRTISNQLTILATKHFSLNWQKIGNNKASGITITWWYVFINKIPYMISFRKFKNLIKNKLYNQKLYSQDKSFIVNVLFISSVYFWWKNLCVAKCHLLYVMLALWQLVRLL